LSQNYPNPFNPTTRIEYSVPRSSYITLKVYNLLGQEVATLFEAVRQPGSYQATFSAIGRRLDSSSGSVSSGDGSRLASGVYLYRLKAEDFVETKKLVLLK